VGKARFLIYLRMPFIVGIGGAHSRAGKTTCACSLLRRLKGWGAVKCTPVNGRPSIIAGKRLLNQKDKDTARLLEAGAETVLWVKAPRNEMEKTLKAALGRLSHLKGVIIEGNSGILAVKPDIVIFVRGKGEIKRGADAVLSIADIIV